MKRSAEKLGVSSRRRQFGAALSKATRRVRGFFLTMRIRLHGGQSGRRLEVERGLLVRWTPHEGLRLGDDVYFGRGVVLDAPSPASLIIGDRVKVMHYTILASSEHVSIGARTQIAEHCSVRDADHDLAGSSSMLDGALVSSPVVIADEAWIARGVAVLRGSRVERGAVVGANSVVRGVVPTMSIAVGAPARVVGYRSEDAKDE